MPRLKQEGEDVLHNSIHNVNVNKILYKERKTCGEKKNDDLVCTGLGERASEFRFSFSASLKEKKKTIKAFSQEM